MTATDKEIITAMQADGEKGFRMLMNRYGEPLYWHIRRLVVSHDDANDAVQETFIRIFRSFSRNSDIRSFRAWLYRIATNEALRLLERKRNDSMPLESVFDARAESYIDYDDVEAVRLQKAILSLPPKQQLAFNLRYYDDMDYEDIATVADSTPASVKANYHHAKESIIRYMQSND